MSSDSLFDIMGPVMIGPSSSHTAGAVRLGLLARCIAGQTILKADFHLYNSFAKTYQGHGTDRGLIAGLLGHSVDSDAIRDAFTLAKDAKLDVQFIPHPDTPSLPPNTVHFVLTLGNSERLSIMGHSVGGGKVYVSKVNDYHLVLKGDYPTLVMFYKDKPGMIWQVTKHIAEADINIASLVCSRQDKGQEAFMAICLDSLLPQERVDAIQAIPEVYYVRNVDKLPS
jgi:L-serine dehydratase